MPDPCPDCESVTVTAQRDDSASSDVSGGIDEIIVLGNRGERGWQGNDPNPTKGWRPVRDANGNLTGWERKNSQTGQKERKSVQWGEQNGLDPSNFRSVPLPPELQPDYIPPSPDSGAVTLAWLLSLLALFNQFDAYTTVP